MVLQDIIGILTLESPEILVLGERQSIQAHLRRGASGIPVEIIGSCFISTEKIEKFSFLAEKTQNLKKKIGGKISAR